MMLVACWLLFLSEFFNGVGNDETGVIVRKMITDSERQRKGERKSKVWMRRKR